MKLYQISDAIERILAECVDEHGEINEEASQRLDQLEESREEKSLAVAKYLKGELAEAEAVEREGKKLLRRAEIHKNRAQSLLAYLSRHVPQDVCYQDPTTRIAWRMTPGRVEFADGQAQADPAQHVDPRFVYKHEELRIDKKRAGEMLKAGTKVKGLKLVRERRIRVE